MKHGLLSFLALFAALMTSGCGGSSAPASPTPTPTPTPTPAAQCGVAPAPSNPAGGGGTPAQIQIDPGVYGTADTSRVTTFAFSQAMLYSAPLDPEVAQLVPDIDPRAWQRWDRGGLLATDYNPQAPAAARAQGTLFMGGTTATAVFRDEPIFQQAATCNAAGQLVPHDSSASPLYRGSLASTQYRDYLLQIAETQIDAGVDGLFFDEVQGTYNGATYDGNEGFDDANIADFGGYLCAKHPSLTPDQWASQFGILAADHLDCTLPAATRGRTFDFRGYMARRGVAGNPISLANPLAAEWGRASNTRVDLSSGSFTITYVNLVYWQDLVLRLRTYARQRYGKEILITANGILPFVDFQMPNTYEYNNDMPDGSTANYLTVTSDGHFDGTRSWQVPLQQFRKVSRTLMGRDVLMTLFIDWPGGLMNSYFQLPLQDRQDYMRAFTAESYANGIMFSLPLRTSMPGDPLASDLGMMGIFGQLHAFYKSHQTLYHGGTDISAQTTVSAPHLMVNLVGLADGSRVMHLVNHNYAVGFQTQTNVQVSFPMPQQPASVTLASPDFSSDQAAAFTYTGGQVQVTVPQLVSYVAILASSPAHAAGKSRPAGDVSATGRPLLRE
jgi:hypothetical protein